MVSRKHSQIPDDPIDSGRIKSAGRVSLVYRASPWMIIRVAFDDGDKKIIARPTTPQGVDEKKIPKALLEIEQAIFDTATRIKWKKSN